ncbi:MAG: hypothetical protein RR246_05735 [Clostridia bacterium]
MLYPTIQQLTKGKINRYSLVIATAKGARFITDKYNRELEESSSHRDNDKISKDSKPEVLGTNVNDKAVSLTVGRINSGEYKIVIPK